MHERAMDGGNQIGQMMLQDVIVGASLERLEDRLFAKRTGDKDHRHIRRFLARQFEGRKAVETRQSVIQQDYVGPVVAEFGEEFLFSFNALGSESEATLAQLPVH